MTMRAKTRFQPQSLRRSMLPLLTCPTVPGRDQGERPVRDNRILPRCPKGQQDASRSGDAILDLENPPARAHAEDGRADALLLP